MTTKFNPKKYGSLLADTLPAVIDTEEENDRLTEVLNDLMNKGEENLSPEESKLFDLLVKLIEDYELKNHRIEPAPPYLVLQRLMENRGVRQKDLLHIFGSDGIASEVVNGKRGISKAHAKKLAEYFDVSVELFI